MNGPAAPLDRHPAVHTAQHDLISRLGWAAFCLVAYLLYIIVGLDPLGGDVANAQMSDGNLAGQLASIGLTLLLLVMTWRSDRVLRNLALPWPVLLLMGYCLLTVTWSAVPDIAFRRWVQSFLTMWVLFRAVDELGYARSLWFLRLTMLLLLVGNYFAVAFLAHGIHTYEFGEFSSVVGNWRGLLDHKNLAGPVAAFTILLFTFDRRGASPHLCNAVVLASLVFLYFTQSKSSMSGLAVALAGGFAIRFIKLSRNVEWMTRLLLGLIMLLPLAAIVFGNELQQLGDRDSFTGRARIWSALLLYARTHFWTGAGFGSFWHVGNASPVLSLAGGWVANLAAAGHNGYLDLMVTIGFPGLLLALLVLLILPTQRLLAADSIPDNCRSLLFSIIAFCLWHNLAESQLVEAKTIDQLFLSMAIALVGRARSPGRGPQHRQWLARRVRAEAIVRPRINGRTPPPGPEPVQ